MLSSLTLLFLTGVAALSGVAPAADSPLIDDARLQAAGMYRYWQARLPIARGDSLLEGHLVDEALYVITDNGSVFALKADVGLIRWAAKLTEPDYRVCPPRHIRTVNGAGHVVIPTPTKVFIFDRFSGDLAQSFTPGFAAGSAVVAYDDKLFMGSADGRFYSLKLDYAFAMEPFKRWEVLAGGPVTATPVLYDHNMLLFASQSGTVYSCRAADKTLNWAYRTDGPIMGDPVVDESGVYVASMDRSLYKLHPTSGMVMWRARLPRPLAGGPVVTAHTVYQYGVGHGISAIDADTGREKWRSPNGCEFVAHSRSGDVVFTHDRRLLVVDHDSGEVQYTIDAQAVGKTVPNARNDAVYLLGPQGRILCARLDSVPYLRRQQVTAARAQLNRPPPDDVETVRRAQRGAAVNEADLTANDPLRSRQDIRP
ncbi:MAG: PQQ-binding-like beta-propeller repeat protein [Phycisphaerae bacterium]